ncbi:glycosyltransferase [Sphaerotilus hippei]|nr:glycosyltransferase [Sphaerotilus hippei]
MEKVVAVVVTFNRKALLIECLAALLRQSCPLQKIVLIDNASTDGTHEALGELGHLSHPSIDYHRLSSNTGGAGGFHEGMKRGLALAPDWLWLMDDDAEPADDALEQLQLGQCQDSTVAVACMPVGTDGVPQWVHRGWHDPKSSDLVGLTHLSQKDLIGTPVQIGFASFVGICVSARAARQIDLPRKEFFIHFDDYEYCIRLGQLGDLWLMPHSLILHKDARTAGGAISGSVTRQVLKYDRLWLTYFGPRNRLWMRLHQASLDTRIKVLMAESAEVLRHCAGALRHRDDHMFRRCLLRIFSFVDGVRGNFDNERPRKVLFD